MMYGVAIGCTDPSMASILSAVRKILTLIQIIVPILLIVGSGINIIRLVQDPEDKKRKKNVLNSVIAAVIIFFIPMLIDTVMSMVGDDVTFSACWNNAEANIAREVTYIPIEDSRKRSNGFIIDPSEYEKGKPKPPSSTGGSTGGGSGQTYTGGNLVKEETTDTLKVSIYRSNSYYVTRIWVKNAYQQLNKYDSPNYGSGLYRPGDLMNRAMSQNGLSNKLMVGFNASGFYLRNTYDSASVNAYAPYDRTSVGSLVITNGKVVRNAYNHAVKTWYITGVDRSNRMRIFEDVKSNNASEKKAWSESIIGSIRNTYTFASPLVVNGQASNITTSMPSPSSALNRQAFCQIDSNNFALITGAGLSRQSMINIMLSMGCQTGTNFDGGGSIALLFKSHNSKKIETITGNGRSLTEVGYFTE